MRVLESRRAHARGSCFVPVALVVLAQVVTTRPTTGAEIALPASRDNSLFEDAAGSLSNGAGEYLFVGTTRTDEIRRAVIAFDIAAHIPKGSVVQRAQLTLNMSKTISDNQSVSLHRLEADWGEGTSDADGEEGTGTEAAANDATWLHAFHATTRWSLPGGDFASAPSGVQSVGREAGYTWESTPEMVADVQLWLDEPASDFGWILIGEEGERGTAKRFDSRERAEDFLRPVLTVEYAPPVTSFRRGDANADGHMDISDAVHVLNFLFTGGPPPSCRKSADGDDNGALQITDAVRMLSFLFLGGASLPEPFLDCGPDPSDDGLSCETHAPCE